MSCCAKNLTVLSVTPTVGTQLVVNLNEVPLQNLAVYNLHWCINHCGLNGNEFVYFNIGGTSYNVYDKAGNWLQVGHLRKGMRLRLVYGDIPADRAHFEVIHNLPDCLCLTPVVDAEA